MTSQSERVRKWQLMTDGAWYLKTRGWILIIKSGAGIASYEDPLHCRANWRSSSPQDITGVSPHSGSASRHYEIPEWKRSTCPERCAFVSESFPLESLPLFLALSEQNSFVPHPRSGYLSRVNFPTTLERGRWPISCGDSALIPTRKREIKQRRLRSAKNDRSKRFFSTVHDARD